MSAQHWGYLLAAATTLAWGLVVIPVKAARAPGTLGLAISMPVGLLALLPVLAVFRPALGPLPQPLWPPLLATAAAGLCQFPLATACYYEAIRRADVSVVAPLKGIKTLLVIGWVVAFGLEPVTGRMALAGLGGMLGAALLTWDLRPSAGARRAPGAAAGVGYALLACVFWSLGDILMRRSVQAFPPLLATAAALLCGTAVYSVWLAATGRLGAVRGLPGRAKVCFAVHGAVSFALGYGAFFAAIRHLGVTRAVIITSAWPMISFAAGVLGFGEPAPARNLAGVALLMASVYLIVIA